MSSRANLILAIAAAGCILTTGTALPRHARQPGFLGLEASTALGLAQEKTDPKSIKNPVPSDEKSIAEGRKVFGRSCVSCHGPGGKGDGGMAVGGSTPADLTDAKWQQQKTDGEIFVVIRDGLSADMDGYKDKLTDTQMWQVIDYIRTLKATDK